MIGSVEDDEFDVQSGLESGWATAFFILYIIVMIISLVLYMLTIRAVALEIRVHNPTYILVLLLFLAAVIEFGVMIGEFMAKFGYFSYTDVNCKLVTFIIYGNRILQISTAITMLYYNMLASYLKTTKFQLNTKRYMPVIIVSLLILETVMVLYPTLGIRSSIAEQWCEFVNPDPASRSLIGWLYTVLFPYFFPLVFAIGPFIYLALRVKEGHIIEPQKSEVIVSLAIVSSYFLFYLLYFILMIARQVNFLIDLSQMNRMLGTSLAFITRPMFVLIGHIWHISVPLSVLLLDKELRQQWPGSWMLRGRYRSSDEESENSIVMSDVSSLDNVSNNNQETKNEVSNNFSVMMLENREFHNNFDHVQVH